MRFFHKFQENSRIKTKAVWSPIIDGSILGGSLPSAKMKLVQAWIEIHREDLLVNWKLAVAGEPVFKINPLR